MLGPEFSFPPKNKNETYANYAHDSVKSCHDVILQQCVIFMKIKESLSTNTCRLILVSLILLESFIYLSEVKFPNGNSSNYLGVRVGFLLSSGKLHV